MGPVHNFGSASELPRTRPAIAARPLSLYVDLAAVDDLIAAFSKAVGVSATVLDPYGEPISHLPRARACCDSAEWAAAAGAFLASGGMVTCQHGARHLIVPIHTRRGETLAAIALGPLQRLGQDGEADDSRALAATNHPAALPDELTLDRAQAAASLLARTFETIVREAEIASESADLEAAQRQVNRDLSVLYAVARVLNSSTNLGSMLQRLVQVIGELLEGDVVLVGLIEGNEVVTTASFGLRTLEARRGRLRVGEGLAGRVAASGKPLMTPDMRVDPREYMTATNAREQLHGYAGAPIILQGTPVGVLSLYYHSAHETPDHEIQLLTHVAEQIAVALERVRLQEHEQAASGELESLQDQVQAHHRSLTLMTEIHEQLTQIVLHDGGLDAIVATLARLLNAQVALEDQFHHILAQSPNGPSPAPGEWHGNLAATPPPALQDSEIQLLFAVALETRRPVTMPVVPQIGLTRARIVAPIMVSGDLLGYLAVADEAHPLGSAELLAVSHATTVIALEMMKQRTQAEVERRLRGEILEELIDGRSGDVNRLHRRASYLGHNLAVPHALIVLAVDRPDVATPAARKTSEVSVAEILQDLVSAYGYNPMVISRSEGIGAAFPAPTGDLSEARSVVDALCRDALRRGVRPVSIGVGRICHQPDDYPLAWTQACKALGFARTLDRTPGVVVYEDLGIFRFLLDLPSTSEAVSFAHQLLGPLAAYDARHDTGLLQTLETFLAANGVLQRTAGDLSIHVNTLTYRLQRIQELTGLDLRRSESRLEAHLAIKILEALRRTGV